MHCAETAESIEMLFEELTYVGLSMETNLFMIMQQGWKLKLSVAERNLSVTAEDAEGNEKWGSESE